MIKIIDYKDFSIDDFRNKAVTNNKEISNVVEDIISNVKKYGDKALFEYTKKFDGANINSKNILVDKKEIDKALKVVSEKFLNILKEAKENIYAFHLNQKRSGFIVNSKDGIVAGQKIVSIEKVGLYIPGGSASYPSSVLMNAIPAKIAGVKELCMATPPGKDGNINPNILAAAYIAGVDKIYKMGGAQSIAALAYGTESVGKVDKITGPGNAYVAEAKKQVYGKVAIDMIAGPSEILIIADESADSEVLAIDLLSQAEHDRMATSVLLTTSLNIANKCKEAIEKNLKTLERKEIAKASIDTNGLIVVTPEISSAIEISEKIAPEHLELQVKNPFDYLSLINNAGSIFLGSSTPEALGDYFAGANHTLPTSGTARFASPLSVDDFVKKIQYTYYNTDAFEKIGEKVAFFADAEGLTAHAKSARIRLKK